MAKPKQDPKLKKQMERERQIAELEAADAGQDEAAGMTRDINQIYRRGRFGARAGRLGGFGRPY